MRKSFAKRAVFIAGPLPLASGFYCIERRPSCIIAKGEKKRGNQTPLDGVEQGVY